MKTTLKISLAALLTVAACLSTAQTVSTLRGETVPVAGKALEAHNYLGSKPGGQELILRTFQEQPPLVPHKVDGFDEITTQDNACLDCHIHTEVRGQKIPQVKESHLIKPVNFAAPQIDKARWQCNNCHVPQSDAKPLVDNLFKGNVVSK